jgi:SRSO17 transposase
VETVWRRYEGGLHARLAGLGRWRLAAHGAVWDDQQVLDIASAWAVSHPGDGNAVLIAGETADEKSSADCAGAARQYSGTVAGIALSQVAVTLTCCTSPKPCTATPT